MKKLIVLWVAFVLVGCGSGYGGPDGVSSRSSNNSRTYASAKVHTELAGMYYEQAQYAIALEEIGLALRAEPEYAPAFNMRALVHMALLEDKEAAQDFERAIRLDGRDSETRNNYGWYLCQHGREAESLEQFMAAVKNPLYSTPEKAYLNAGICARKAGDVRAAQAYFQRALAARPNMPAAHYESALLAFDGHDYAGARASFMRFERASAEPLGAEALWLGLRIARQLGDREVAESYTLQLRKRYPDARETQLIPNGK